MRYKEQIRLRIPGATEHVAVARNAVDAVSEGLRLSPDARAAIKLAVGEACDNAVRHTKRPGAPVIVIYRAGRDVVEIDVGNRGNDFHPSGPAEMPPAEALAEHGRGLALIELLMDDVEYLSERGNTIVRMRLARPLAH